jgi:hypothetical protein
MREHIDKAVIQHQNECAAFVGLLADSLQVTGVDVKFKGSR